ncbi:MAG: hypothetical protein OHK0028_03580 [Deltaproteobacteria bacterium]
MTAIRFTIGGPGIDAIVRTVPVTGPVMTVTLQVPTGPARTILVEALDSGGFSRFRGSAVVDTAGAPLAITIGMAVDPSNPALQAWSVVHNTVSTSATLNRVAQGGGIVLAGGTSGELLSSIDGITWTSRDSRNISGDISSLSFGGNTFLAMTSAGNFTAFPVTWTNRFFGAPSDNVDDWTARGVIGTVESPLAEIAFGGGVFVVVGGNAAFRSIDNGSTWSPGTITGMQGLSHVAYGNGRFVAIGVAGDNVAVSTDGTQWETHAMGLPSGEVPDLLGFGNGTFVATTSSGSVLLSIDGIAWQPRTPFADLSGLDISTSSIVAGGGGFMAVTTGSLYFTFDSGVTWTEVVPLPSGFYRDGICWNGAFVVVGSTGPGSVFRSGNL